MYEVSAAINDVKVMRIPLNEDFQIVLKDVITCLTDKSLKIIFICSPNNPTANSMNESDIEYIISNFHGIVVLDEAYIDFSDKPSLLKMIYRYSNLIVIQTFSKALGLAAVRIGMAFSNKNIIHYFNKMKPPYNISTINQKAALQKIGNIEEYESQVKEIKKERERLSENLKQLSITVRVFPSDANFLLVKVKNAGYIYKTLVDKKIIVRNRSNVVQDCLRITIGSSFENDKLINELKQITI
jgi:histidinol-phosphate aminotransferase